MDSPDILNDPMIKLAATAHVYRAEMRARLADQVMSTKTWYDMNNKEQEICITHLVSQANTEEELRKLLFEELGVDYFEISWLDTPEDDKTAQEAKMLMQAIGGLVSKTGALVNIMTMESVF